MRLFWAIGACSLGLSAASPARADPEESIRIGYEAPVGCPDEASFLAKVRARTTRWRTESGTSPARRFVIVVDARPRKMRGRLTLTDAAGAPGVREVEGPTCADVVDALALVTALAIDPHASLGPVPEAPPLAPPRPAILVRAKLAVLAPPPRPAGWALIGGAGTEVSGSVAPVLAIGMRAFVETRSTHAGIFSPGLRLLVQYDSSGPVARSAGTAHFVRAVGGLDLCPLRLPIGGASWTFVPCAEVLAGVLRAAGSGVPLGRRESRTWLSGGVVGRVEGALSARVVVYLEGGALLPVLRYHSSFPSFPLYDTPLLGGFASVGTALRFW